MPEFGVCAWCEKVITVTDPLRETIECPLCGGSNRVVKAEGAIALARDETTVSAEAQTGAGGGGGWIIALAIGGAIVYFATNPGSWESFLRGLGLSP